MMEEQMTPEGAKCRLQHLHHTDSHEFTKTLLSSLIEFCGTGHSTAAQRFRLLNELLVAGPAGVSTIQARETLDIIAPAARICELRTKFGFPIFTRLITESNAQGNEHRVALYILIQADEVRTAS